MEVRSQNARLDRVLYRERSTLESYSFDSDQRTLLCSAPKVIEFRWKAVLPYSVSGLWVEIEP